VLKPSDLYVQGIYDRFSYFATWLPNTTIVLGDVGMKQGRYFQRVTSLEELKIPFKVRSGTVPIDFTYASQASINIQAEASGEVGMGVSPSLAKAGLSIEFAQEGAFLFQAVKCLVDEIEDKAALGRIIIDSYRAGTWDNNWAVIDTVVKAGSAIILISNSVNAQVELSAKATLLPGILADPNAGLAIRSQRGDITELLAKKGLTPLFRLSQVKNSIFALFKKEKITFGGKSSTGIADLSEVEEVWETLTPS